MLWKSVKTLLAALIHGLKACCRGLHNRLITFLLTCVPTEGGFRSCVPEPFGADGRRGGASL